MTRQHVQGALGAAVRPAPRREVVAWGRFTLAGEAPERRRPIVPGSRRNTLAGRTSCIGGETGPVGPIGRGEDLRVSTRPHAKSATPRARFAALGDLGVGSDSRSSRRQRRIVEVLDTMVSVHDVRFGASLGDTINQGEDRRVRLGAGDEDTDWYAAFYQPHRYRAGPACLAVS